MVGLVDSTAGYMPAADSVSLGLVVAGRGVGEADEELVGIDCDGVERWWKGVAASISESARGR